MTAIAPFPAGSSLQRTPTFAARPNAVASSSKSPATTQAAYTTYIPPLQVQPVSGPSPSRIRPSAQALAPVKTPSAKPALKAVASASRRVSVQSRPAPPAIPLSAAPRPSEIKDRTDANLNLPTITVHQCHSCARFLPLVPFLPDSTRPRGKQGYYPLSKICIKCTDQKAYEGQMRYWDTMMMKAMQKYRSPFRSLLFAEGEDPALRLKLRAAEPLDLDVLDPMTDEQIPGIRYDFVVEAPVAEVAQESVVRPVGRSGVRTKPVGVAAVPYPKSKPNPAFSRLVRTGVGGPPPGSNGTGALLSAGRIASLANGTGIALVNGSGGKRPSTSSAHPVEAGDVCPIYWMGGIVRDRKWIFETFASASIDSSLAQKDVWREYMTLFRDSPNPTSESRVILKMITDLVPGSHLGLAIETEEYRIFGLRRKPYGSGGEIGKLYLGIVGRGRRRTTVVQHRACVGLTIKVVKPVVVEEASGQGSGIGRPVVEVDAPPRQAQPRSLALDNERLAPDATADINDYAPPAPLAIRPQRTDPAVEARTFAKSSFKLFVEPVSTFQLYPGDVEAGLPVTRHRLGDSPRQEVPFKVKRATRRRAPEEVAAAFELQQAKPKPPKQHQSSHESRSKTPNPRQMSTPIVPLPSYFPQPTLMNHFGTAANGSGLSTHSAAADQRSPTLHQQAQQCNVPGPAAQPVQYQPWMQYHQPVGLQTVMHGAPPTMLLQTHYGVPPGSLPPTLLQQVPYQPPLQHYSR